MGGFVRGLAVLAALSAIGCLDARVTHCDDGSVCPAGTTCDVEHGRCLTEEQVSACGGLDDGDACELAGIPQAVCVFGACEPAGCGDGVVLLPEQCEPEVEVTETCATLGFYVDNGPVGCHADCTFDTTSCAETCGDGEINGNEECELLDVPELDCIDFGYYQPDGLRCTTFCRFDVSLCQETCGDHVLNGPEICEDDPPEGQSCLDYGFDTGLLACTGTCTPDFTGCEYLGWRMRPTGVPTLADVWGATPDDVWAVGPDGAVVHFDGEQWTDLTAEVGETADLFAIWGASASDIWVVGDAGRILHYDGTTWSGSDHGTAALRGVWGTAADDVWVVGYAGTVLRWNGTTWSTETPPTVTDLTGVWGTPGDVWISGWDVALRWRAGTWDTVLADPAVELIDVWGSDADSVTLVGWNQPSYRWDGATLRPLATSAAASAAAGARATHSILGGDAFIFHHDGTELAYAELPAPRAVLGAWGFSDGTIVAVGTQGSALHWEAQIGWTRQIWNGGLETLRDVWMASPYHGYAISVQGGVYELIESGQWIKVATMPVQLYSIGGTAADDVWATGISGRIWHYTGGIAWIETPTGTTQPIWATWGSARNDVYAVGEGGTILHWNGSAWSAMTSGTTEALLAVWGSGPGDVFAVGTTGTILHYDGASWTPMTTGTTAFFRGVSGTGPDDVWAVAQTGGVHHWDGVAWTAAGPDVDESFYRIAAFAPDDVLVGGSGGRLHHWDGAVWTPIRPPVSFEIIGMSGGPQAIYLVAGGGGDTMLRMIRTDVCAATESRCRDYTDEDCDGEVDCDDPECAGDAACAGAGPCGPGTVVTCGSSVNGTTSGGGNDITDYGCAVYPTHGPDVGYRFTSAIERDVIVNVAPTGSRVLDLMILGSAATGACGPADHCIEAIQPASGDAQATFRAHPGVTYHLVVDGFRGETASFTLQVTCP